MWLGQEHAGEGDVLGEGPVGFETTDADVGVESVGETGEVGACGV